MEPQDAAWLSAAVDGEGGIYINKTHTKKWPERNHVSVTIIVTNTNRDFVEKARGLMHGFVSSHQAKGCKRMYQAGIGRHDEVLKILEEILPYLIIKRQKALEVMQFIRKKDWGKWAPEFRENMSKASLETWKTRPPEARHAIAMKVVEARRKNPSTRYYKSDAKE